VSIAWSNVDLDRRRRAFAGRCGRSPLVRVRPHPCGEAQHAAASGIAMGRPWPRRSRAACAG